jgi:hypothetical protein
MLPVTVKTRKEMVLLEDIIEQVGPVTGLVFRGDVDNHPMVEMEVKLLVVELVEATLAKHLSAGLAGTAERHAAATERVEVVVE